MSGGTFNYNQYSIKEIAVIIREIKIKKKIKKEALHIADELEKLYKIVHALDYCLAYDTSEETFLEEYKKYRE